MNTEDLIQEVANKLTTPQNKETLKEVVLKLFATITDRVQKGEKVKVRSFGTFQLKKLKPTSKLLPGKTTRTLVPERSRFSFLPSTKLHAALKALEEKN